MWKGGGEKGVLNRVKKKEVKTWPCPCTQSLRGMGAIIALPKNKRGKMTVEDTVTKSSSGQIGGPALWRVSHKRQTTQPPPPPAPLPLPPQHRRCLTLCSLSDQVPIIGEATPWGGLEGSEMPVRIHSAVSGGMWLEWGLKAVNRYADILQHTQADKHGNKVVVTSDFFLDNTLIRRGPRCYIQFLFLVRMTWFTKPVLI